MKKYIPGETKEQRKARKNLAKAKKQQTTATTTLPVITESPTSNKIAFVIGNGTSRNPIALPSLRPFGKIYGCNALYRDFIPDYLVAVDTKMVLELNKAGVQHQVETWTNPNRAYSEMHGFNFFQPSKGWSSGPTALWLASQHGPKQIFILGFDYTGKDGGNHFNNIYADSDNYKKTIDGATYHGNWLKQTATTIKEHPRINYTRVIAKDNYCPEELNILSNYSTMDIEHFLKIFSI